MVWFARPGTHPIARPYNAATLWVASLFSAGLRHNVLTLLDRHHTWKLTIKKKRKFFILKHLLNEDTFFRKCYYVVLKDNSKQHCSVKITAFLCLHGIKHGLLTHTSRFQLHIRIDIYFYACDGTKWKENTSLIMVMPCSIKLRWVCLPFIFVYLFDLLAFRRFVLCYSPLCLQSIISYVSMLMLNNGNGAPSAIFRTDTNNYIMCTKIYSAGFMYALCHVTPFSSPERAEQKNKIWYDSQSS